MRTDTQTDKQNESAKALLNPRQVAAQANYQTPVSVLRAFRRGQLVGYKLNARTIRFHPDDVAKWLSSARVGNGM
jgi:hypothetical protein